MLVPREAAESTACGPLTQFVSHCFSLVFLVVFLILLSLKVPPSMQWFVQLYKCEPLYSSVPSVWKSCGRVGLISRTQLETFIAMVFQYLSCLLQCAT